MAYRWPKVAILYSFHWSLLVNLVPWKELCKHVEHPLVSPLHLIHPNGPPGPGYTFATLGIAAAGLLRTGPLAFGAGWALATIALAFALALPLAVALDVALAFALALPLAFLGKPLAFCKLAKASAS